MSFFKGTFSPFAITGFPLDPEGDKSVDVLAYDLILPMALTAAKRRSDDRDKFLFPVKVDSGFSGEFHISLTHFLQWGRWLEPLSPKGKNTHQYANADREIFIAFAGNLWLANTARTEVKKIPLNKGFTICDVLTEDGDPIPRIPLIGQAALEAAQCVLTVNYARKTFEVEMSA
jgi:hypothetical protein